MRQGQKPSITHVPFLLTLASELASLTLAHSMGEEKTRK